eukprot:gnl/Chilomastix_cuspidata/2694.p1 GENE.gnl/Chilomastix_cuspidata/2694~~gnl/Chilomastix_cuspidata/2694.p1  ORF type:complete len:243 (+),score=66.95 gnl/Chilomastix_cuspidata/2694:84-731(+)
MKYILLFPGSFNPVTSGHLLIAESAHDFVLSEFEDCTEAIVVFSVVGDMYPKPGLLDYKTRAKMLELSTKDNEHFRVDTWEAEQPAFVPSLRLLEHYSGLERSAKVCMLCGADLIATMTTDAWKREHVQRIFANFILIALARETGRGAVRQAELRARLNAHFAADYFSLIRFMLGAPFTGISSTLVRERLRGGRSVRYLVAPALEAFLHREGLYK